jgi:adenosine deaminase
VNFVRRAFLSSFSFLFLTLPGYAMELDLLPLFQEMPKAELHLHLGGSYPLDYLLDLASPPQQQALLNSLEMVSKKVDYHEGFKIFGLIGQIVNSDDKVEKGVAALCRALEKDGVVYAEIRTNLKDLGTGLEGYLQSVLRGMRSERLQTRLLLSLQRASTLSHAQRTVDLAIKYRGQGVVGIDLSGDSTIGQIEAILPELKRARQAGLFLTVHMGESPKELNQKALLEALQPHRIGHGVHLAQDALEWIFDHRVPIEVCPTSSVLVQMIGDYSAHPGLGYYLQGHPVVICTDDPLIFQNSLSSELFALSEKTFLNYNQLRQLAKSAIEHAFLSAEEKQMIADRSNDDP